MTLGPLTNLPILAAASNAQLIGVSILGVALILYLVIFRKLHAFVALLLVSILVGLAAGMPLLSTSTQEVVMDDYVVGDRGETSEEEHFQAIADRFESVYRKKKGEKKPTGPHYFDLGTRQVKAEQILSIHPDHLLVDTDMAEGEDHVAEEKIPFAELVAASGIRTTKTKGIIDTVKGGMGGILGFVAIVVGLGAMFGQMLEVSGGAERLAKHILDKFGDDKASWALGIVGFLVSIPVFLDVGLIIIIPIVYTLAHRTGKPLLYYGIPLLAGLAVTHSMIPPTPGPIAVADLLGADLGWVILFGCVAGVPAMVLACLVFAKYISQKVVVPIPDFVDFSAGESDRPLPSFRLVLWLILTPLVMILCGTTIGYLSPEEAMLTRVVKFIGDPIVAMLAVTLLAFYTLGKFCGYTRQEVQDIATKALEPAGIIILVTGAGGVFKQVLIDSGVGQMLGQMMAGSAMPPVVLAFVVTTFVRVAQGSATVAMVTGGGIMAGIIAGAGIATSAPMLGLLAISIACGATVFSHVNDSGFWLVNRFFGMSVKDTLKTWTVLETIIGFVGFGVVFALSLFIK